MIEKSGQLIRGFENGGVDLTLSDCVKLAAITAIPLTQFLTPREVREVAQANDLLRGAVADAH